MGILNRRRTTTAPALPAGRDERTFAAELPIGETEPLWRLQLQWLTQAQGDGDRMVLRAHLQTNFASALRPALAAPHKHPPRQALTHGSHSGGLLRLRERAGHAAQQLAQRALRAPLIRRLAEPLLEFDVNTWVEIQASTASLNSGSHSLLPQAERLAKLGIHPRTPDAQPVAETWAGDAGTGFAQVSVLQMDRRHLPPRLQKLLGKQPFGLAATVVNTAEPKPANRHR